MSTALARNHRLEVLREVASGPSATVFAAELCEPQGPGTQRRLVALKVARMGTPREAESPEDHTRRVADDLVRALGVQRRLAALRQRHMVCAHGLAVVGGRPALVRDWVEGIDLLDWVEVLRETGIELPARVVCEVVRSVAVALDAALNRTPWGDVQPAGIVHRDLKPTNILVGRDGDVRVLDFGCGYSAIGHDDSRTGALRAGLLKYMAPEVRQGESPRPSADVYSLGILAVELFRGRWLRRLRGANPAHDRHLAEVVASMDDPDLRSQADDRALRNLLLRMVAFEPIDRPSAVEVAQTLRSLGDRAPGPSLETFAHDHALPYLEPPSPRLDDAPGASWGLAGLENEETLPPRLPEQLDEPEPPDDAAATPETPPLGPQEQATDEVTQHGDDPVASRSPAIPAWHERPQLATWLALGGLLVLSAGALLGAGATALLVLLYRF